MGEEGVEGGKFISMCDDSWKGGGTLPKYSYELPNNEKLLCKGEPYRFSEILLLLCKYCPSQIEILNHKKNKSTKQERKSTKEEKFKEGIMLVSGKNKLLRYFFTSIEATKTISKSTLKSIYDKSTTKAPKM